MTVHAILFLLAGLLACPDDAARLAELIAGLGAADWGERDAATGALEKIGAPAEPALRAVAAGDDAEAARRARYLLRLFELRRTLPERVQAAVPGAARRIALEEAWPEVLLEAAGQRGLLNADLEPLVPEALKRATDSPTRRALLETLPGRMLDLPADLVRPMLSDPDAAVREAAAAVVGELELIRALLAKLERDDRGRGETFSQLFHHSYERAIAFLAKRILDDDASDEELADLLSDWIHDDEDPRATALRLLGTFLPEAVLTDRLHQEKARVRVAVIEALAARGRVPQRVRDALDDEDAGVRRAAVGAVGALPADTGWAAAMQARLGDVSPAVRRAAVEALITARAKTSKKALREEITGALLLALTGDAELRDVGLSVLLAGPLDEPPDARVLEAIGPAALLASVESGDPEARFRAVWALRWSDADPERALAALIDALGDEHPPVRAWAAVSLGELGERAAPAVPALVAALAGQSGSTAHQAAQALGRIGPAARAALPALERARARPSLEAVAEEAIARIEGR